MGASIRDVAIDVAIKDRCRPQVYAGILGLPVSRRAHQAHQTLGAYLGSDKPPSTARHHRSTQTAPSRQLRNKRKICRIVIASSQRGRQQLSVQGTEGVEVISTSAKRDLAEPQIRD